MTNLERVWRQKSDEQLADAVKHFGDYTAEGQAIRAELQRRGIEPPENVVVTSTAPAVEGPRRRSLRARIIGYELCSKCMTETDPAALVKLSVSWPTRSWFSQSEVQLCPRCLEVEFKGGSRIVRGYLPWYFALPFGIFFIGGPVVSFLGISVESRVQVGIIIGFVFTALLRGIPMGAGVLSDVPEEERLDFDRVIAIAKRANVGTTADTECLQLKQLCTGSKEIEALLVIAQFGEASPVDVEAQPVGDTAMAQDQRHNDVESEEVIPQGLGFSPLSEEDDRLPVIPCSACGGRGRIEQRDTHPSFLARLIGAKRLVEKCPECNGSGAAVPGQG